MRIKLGERLQTVLSLIKGGETLCDVGTDHGKLPVAALLSGKAASAIATDISAASLQKARLLAEKENVPLRCLVGDGLAPLKQGEADVIVIAGMGGAEIVRILENAPCRFPRYILLPHRDAPMVRGYLKEQNARILRDVTVKEGKHFYFVIEATFDLPWKDQSLYYGETGGDFEEYRRMRLAKIEKLLSLKSDLSLANEKEELTDAYGGGNSKDL
ncbi:MAG: SAM-dependent methyltransferase [Clostridia bacterium]|nr:SAM-dependent methyltransferase [Clostridia bacterium]